MKRFPPAIGAALGWLALVLAASVSACGGGADAGAAVPQVSTDGTAAAAVGMRDLTSVQLSQQMSPGIDLGGAVRQPDLVDSIVGGAK